jgi:hypothetical protein
MYMRVKPELLIPGVQYAEETDLRTEMFGIASNFQESFRAASKQQVVEDLFILQSEWRQLTRKGEDHMHVARREKLPPTCLEPTVAGTALTLRAVPVATGVVRDGAMPAADALVEMPAQCGGATAPNGQQDFDMLPADPFTASFDERVSRSADKIGHLERWPAHLAILW